MYVYHGSDWTGGLNFFGGVKGFPYVENTRNFSQFKGKVYSVGIKFPAYHEMIKERLDRAKETGGAILNAWHDVDLDNLKTSQSLKNVIRDEFKYVKDLLHFDKKSHEIFRNWYVDGRLYYHKVIDLEKPDEGLKEVRHIDALKLKLMRIKPKPTRGQPMAPLEDQIMKVGKDAEISEFYTYYPQGTAQKYGSIAGKGIKLSLIHI